MTNETSFGTITVRHAAKPGDHFKLTLTFVDRAEYDKTLTILAGIKEVEFDYRWGASLYTAEKAVEDISFWLFNRAPAPRAA
jgi:hypothetical protein